VTYRSSKALHTGWLAGVVFAVAMFWAGAQTPGYEHAMHSVSLLGSSAAAMPRAFNIAGFIAPGLLLAIFALALGRELRALGAGFALRLAVNFLLIAGLAFAGAGLWPYTPGDADDARSQYHVAALGVAMIAMLPSMAVLAAALRARGWRPLPQLGGAFAALLLLCLVLPADRWMPGWAGLPGFSQRLALLMFFAWPALVSAVALSRARQRRA
jgi:hypothetical membrane protein